MWTNSSIITVCLCEGSASHVNIKARISTWQVKRGITMEINLKRFGLFIRCSSKIGRHDEPQSVNLGNGCWSMGTVAHELGKYWP